MVCLGNVARMESTGTQRCSRKTKSSRKLCFFLVSSTNTVPSTGMLVFGTALSAKADQQHLPLGGVAVLGIVGALRLQCDCQGDGW